MHHPLTEQVKAVCANPPDHFIQNLFLTLQCICLSRTVNLARAKDFVAQVIGTVRAQATKPQSNYQRLIRFFTAATTDYHAETLVHSVFRQGMSCLLGILAKPRGMG